MTGTFAGFSLALGLAGLAGFRAFYPLVTVSLVAKFSKVDLFRSPFQLFGSTWVLIVLLFFLAVEIIAARITSDTNLHDFIEAVAKVLSGAFLFAGLFSGIGIFWGLLFGGLVAGLGIVVNALLRPFLSNTFEGMNLSLLTAVEDLTAFIGTVLILIIPAVAILLVSYIIYLAYKRFRQQRRYGPNKRVRALR